MNNVVLLASRRREGVPNSSSSSLSQIYERIVETRARHIDAMLVPVQQDLLETLEQMVGMAARKVEERRHAQQETGEA